MDKPATIRPVLVVRTLGTFGLSGEQRSPTAPRSRKSKALLALLALSARPLGRERLADLLWSDRGTEQARSSLRQALFEIRHADPALEELVEVTPQGLSIDVTKGWSDLDAIKYASGQDDWARVAELLAESGPELLEDLNGVDHEFDDWLAALRASEPARTLMEAIASGERALAKNEAHLASTIAEEVIRLDPGSEPATRLALKTAKARGDQAAARRYYLQLETNLKTEFGALPSAETQALLKRLFGGAEPDVTVPTAGSDASQVTAIPHETGRRVRFSAAAGWLLVVGCAGAIGLVVADRSGSASADRQPLVAVVPFESARADDKALAEGLWDDTRTTLSRSGVVRVLGRTTSEAYASRKLTPADYRQMLDVDYLLDGGIRRQGERVRVTVSLLRTRDGVAVWDHSFDGRLGDPMALQGAIASAIEGRIRGRLAKGGGARPSQIPTTPEVYDLYSQAKSLIRTRLSNNAVEAQRLLDRAIRLDPNFAPAWALSGSALHFSSFTAENGPDWRAKAIRRTNRAIELAPRLAQAYAVSALVNGLNSRASEQKLVKSTSLDPGDAEAWLWLGNVRFALGDQEGGAAAYQRAIGTDPYLTPAVGNLADHLIASNDRRGFARLVKRLERADTSGMLSAALRSELDYKVGDISAGLNKVLPFAARSDTPAYVRAQVSTGLIALQYWDENGRLLNLPPRQVNLMADRQGLDMNAVDRDFLLDLVSMTIFVRAGLNHGGGPKLIAAYHRWFPSTDEYLGQMRQLGQPDMSLPYLAVALKQAGFDAEADRLLTAAEAKAIDVTKRGYFDPGALVTLAKIRAAQGRPAEALRLLQRAFSRGWLPDGLFVPTDLGQDPALRMVDGPKLQRIRKSVLANVARERRETGPIRL